MLSSLTFEEDMYERPCIVDDSKNSLKISIFTLAVRWQCEWNHCFSVMWIPHFRHRYVSLRLLDDCPVGTGVRKPSNEVHKGIDVGEFYIINHKGHSKGSDNQLNQQTAFFVASHGCWCNKFLIALFFSIRLQQACVGSSGNRVRLLTIQLLNYIY